MRSDVLVVGAGPAGSVVACLLAKKHDVVIAEEHPVPGEPLQCAGLVTARGVPASARKSVIGEVRGVRIHSPLGFVLDLEAKSSRAFVLDRPMFDKLLFQEAVDAGAVPMLSSPVRHIRTVDGAISSEIIRADRTEVFTSEIVVGADGYKSVCRKAAGLRGPKHVLRGIQADLKGVDSDRDFVEVFLGRDVAPGFFAWAVPAGELTRVGLCTWDVQHAPAQYLKRLLSRAEYARAERVSTASGMIPIGPGKTAVSGRVLLVGDAACHAKPLSGGGVYTGVKGAELCAQAISEFLGGGGENALRAYDSLWNEAFGKELTRAFRIRKVFVNLNDKKIDSALKLFAEPDVRRLLESQGDIDYPASLASSVLKLAPRLAKFSPEIIESFL
ncbi:MAG: NAD(P)/FAD-dependent oxidoreductase [Candidatus Thermoplasmatota archaeon]|nr:NAD(P)/FAD-dependent oxidoreductase [Candidatus Thermoplasmatota archaeon]